MVFDPATNETRILERGLYFANGLQLARDESFILITEMSRCRVTKWVDSSPWELMIYSWLFQKYLEPTNYITMCYVHKDLLLYRHG